MVTLETGKPLATSFGDQFVCTDQDVADLKAGLPRPETKWCLVELPKEELALLEKGSRFYFHEFSGTAKGENGGKAALCTESATYSLEFLENSNSLMIGSFAGLSPEEKDASGGGEKATGKDEGADSSKPSDAPASDASKAQTPAPVAGSVFGTCKVFAQCRGNLVTKPNFPDVNRVRDLLSDHRFGKLADADAGETTASLQFKVAASPVQLNKTLQEGPYVELDGRWRFLPPALAQEIEDAAISLVTALGWNIEAVDGEALLREVQSHMGRERGELSVPSLEVLKKALDEVLAKEDARPAEAKKDTASGGAAGGAGATSADAAAAASHASATASAAAAAGAGAGGGQLLRFDKSKVERAKALQLLREPPERVRERFGLPPPGPRAKRVRVAGGAGGSAGLQRDALKIEEFAKALQELSGSDMAAEDALKVLGDAVCVDEIEGTLRQLDIAALSRDPFERLSQLFNMQSHWRPERMARLIAPTLGAGQKVDTWLMKWARAVFIQLGEPPKEERMLAKKFAGL